MSRLRYIRDDLGGSGCNPSSDINTLLHGTATTNATIGVSVQPQENFATAGRMSFTTDSTDPGTEDLPAGSTFTFAFNVNAATSPISYKCTLEMLDEGGCTLQGSRQAMAEADFTGTGSKAATFNFDPASAGRWQLRITTKGNGMHGDPVSNFNMDSRSSNSRLIAPDAPSGEEPTRRSFVVT